MLPSPVGLSRIAVRPQASAAQKRDGENAREHSADPPFKIQVGGGHALYETHAHPSGPIYALSSLSAVMSGQHVMCCHTCCRAAVDLLHGQLLHSQAADCPAQPDDAGPQDCLAWVSSVLHKLPHFQAPLHDRTGTLVLQASGGAQLPYLWSPSVVHAEGKGKSYLDDFGSHPGMEKRSYAPGSWEAEAGSQDRAAHTDASRWGSAGLQHASG